MRRLFQGLSPVCSAIILCLRLTEPTLGLSCWIWPACKVMHPSLCGNPAEDCHPRMHYESGFINNWWDETAVRRRIAKEGTGKPTANSLTLGLNNAIAFRGRNLFRTYPETIFSTPILAGRLSSRAIACWWQQILTCETAKKRCT